ncbi:DUF1002 domain-containing protein [Paraclostridium sordellii]|uniref:DUF1002 domain-containing protein n=1 Tax=Paraclostridium sordellii TaxID=1505 RepID=UPI0005DFE12B|nr:DUF1002 domain-containing protein [Paeniclostridium sordellii]CEN26903.1 extracellular protein [[Clostridium] sordellii] [Paeniclostridium sordellii]
MSIKKKIISIVICSTMVLGSISLVFADSSKVVTLGANLTPEQKQTMLKYFGVNKNDAVILDVNNQEERKYLEGIAPESQIGTKTYSCAYVEPTKSGSGINVKTANITWVTSSMIASTLASLGITDANCVIAANFPVSGTGALTGVMKAYEDATGKPLDEKKKEIATEELVVTGDLGQDVGKDKATGIINDIKTQVIKNNTSDTVQIADTINNITNNYNVTLSPEQQKQIENLMLKISKQDYNYKEMKDALESVSNTVNDHLKELGENVNNSGILDTVKGWFDGIGNWVSNLFGGDNKDLGILENTNDKLLGDSAKIDATDKNAINLPSNEEVEGFFTKVWNWFTGLFNNESKKEENTDSRNSQSENTNSESNNNEINDNENATKSEQSSDLENKDNNANHNNDVNNINDVNSQMDNNTQKSN